MLRILNSFLWIIICHTKLRVLPLEGSTDATESRKATFATGNNDDFAIFETIRSDVKPEFASAKHVLLGQFN